MKKLLAILCSFMIVTGAAMTNIITVPVEAQYTQTDLTSAIKAAADWMKNNSDPLSDIGTDASDIAVTAFERAGIDYDYHAYLDGLDPVVEQYGSADPVTSMQRAFMTVGALGGDTGYFGGRDLAGDATYFRSLNSVEEYAGALISLDASGVEIPAGTGISREDYIRNILSYQKADGSFGDVRQTAMAVIALSDDYTRTEYAVTYTDGRGDATATCAKAIDDAMSYLSSQQSNDGDFYSLTDTAMVALAMDSLGVSQSDVRFLKGNKTVIDGLLTYQTTDGGFSEDYNDTNGLATAYALSAMVSNTRILQDKAEFFDFESNDTITLGGSSSGTTTTTTTGSTSSTRATTRPVTTSRPTSTSRPRSTTAPRSSSRPASTPKASNAPKLTPAPTKKPDLVGPVQIVGPIQEHTPEPDINADDDETDNGNIVLPIVIGIIALLAAAAAVILFMAKKKMWIFKKREKQDEEYHAKQHNSAEEHRHYEERRKFEDRRKYAQRGKYKGRR